MIKSFGKLSKKIDNLWNKVVFSYKKVRCDDPNLIRGRLQVRGRGSVVIESGVRINSGQAYNPIGGDVRTCFTLRGGKIFVGKNSGLSNCTLVSDSEIYIGENVNIGGGVKIYDTDFHNIDPVQRRNEVAGIFHGITRKISIEDGAFIGAHSIILKGVSVGRNSVVGAGSVVTKSVPPNEIWAGNPARFIRKI
ncbi:acyltransferase [Mangrovicoccus ximenensis]|uniref:acyltransferase n=1 Tax=Mangrovicoccus ximenensis TaxID=1911570 RepID=UPI000D3839F8|nr:DapH/DapD/GlmU-related protein [Mangrovicoccus ximenensis]